MKSQNSHTSTKKRSPSRIVKLHYGKLILRSVLFIIVLTIYLTDKTLILDNIYNIGVNSWALLLLVIWIIFVVEMVFRFFPSKSESMGCQKQFARNFVPNERGFAQFNAAKPGLAKSTAGVAVLWLILTAVIAALYFSGIIDAAVLIIISLFFAICDIGCILFYCPFQSLIMKNRCCVTCRIYNWDYLMMFAPLVFVVSYFTLSLFIIALFLFIKWEITYHKHPEWFSTETNKSLGCAACTERLCVHKISISSPERNGEDKS